MPTKPRYDVNLNASNADFTTCVMHMEDAKMIPVDIEFDVMKQNDIRNSNPGKMYSKINGIH